jgi:hypothetical protein
VRTEPVFETALAAAKHLIPSMPAMPQNKCAVSFPIRKVHKVPAAWRFVTSCCAVHNEPVASLVDGMAGLLQAELYEYAATLSGQFNMMHGSQIRLANVVTDAAQAAVNLPNTVMPAVQFSADIDSCYDVLPTTAMHPHGIYQRGKVMISLLKQHLTRKYGDNVAIWYKHIGKHRFSVRLSHDKIKGGFNVLQLEQYPDLCQVLLDYCYVEVNGTVYKQITCPQGLKPCPKWVDSMLTVYGIQFVLSRMFDDVGVQLITSLFTH